MSGVGCWRACDGGGEIIYTHTQACMNVRADLGGLDFPACVEEGGGLLHEEEGL
jgi:hypothetical protein